MLRSIAILSLFIIYYCLTIVNAASIHANNNQWNKRPRQFRMQIFSRPDSKGAVQTIRATNGGKFIIAIYKQNVKNLMQFSISCFSLLEFSIKKSGFIWFEWSISQSYLLQSKFLLFNKKKKMHENNNYLF